MGDHSYQMTTDSSELLTSPRAQGDSGKSYSERDAGARKLEEQGDIYFKVFKNDKTLDSMKKLIALKTIISKQLPRMPKPYIVKLIMDRVHESLILIKREKSGERIIGAVFLGLFQSSTSTR